MRLGFIGWQIGIAKAIGWAALAARMGKDVFVSLILSLFVRASGYGSRAMRLDAISLILLHCCLLKIYINMAFVV